MGTLSRLVRDPNFSVAVTLRSVSKLDEGNLGVTKQCVYLSRRLCWMGHRVVGSLLWVRAELISDSPP